MGKIFTPTGIYGYFLVYLQNFKIDSIEEVYFTCAQ